MNYLAHFFLSENDENLIIGNYIADDVKGKAYLNYSSDIQKGILLHRNIDNFTDTHPTVEKSKSLIRHHQNKFSPVVMDVFYDYFLAKRWSEFSDYKLLDFSHNTYNILFKNLKKLPNISQIRLTYMAKSNWLYNYRNIKGINKALTGMSLRTKYKNNMNNAHEILQEKELELDKHFNDFFPDLINYCSERINNT